MKCFLWKIISALNVIYLRLSFPAVELEKSILLFFKVRNGTGNYIKLKKSFVKKTEVIFKGSENGLEVRGAKVQSCLLRFEGTNNKLIIMEDCQINSCSIIIRGDSCKVEIGRQTIVVGGRIVNCGKGCLISIGEKCLFSDGIEIWSSDTHPIFNSSGELINSERPINIGNKVWLGTGVSILKGVTVGDGAVIGMNSVVTRNVPDRTISAGNPNSVINSGITWSKD